MELYVLVTGTIDSMHRWEEDLRAQFLPMYENGKRVKDEKGLVYSRRLGVCPIVPYRIIFDKDNLEKVMEMVGSHDYVLKRYGILNKIVKAFRKLLRLHSVPKPVMINPFMQPNQIDKAVAVIPIGLKDDFIDENGKEQI